MHWRYDDVLDLPDRTMTELCAWLREKQPASQEPTIEFP
jgi:hypothetical protein